METTILKAPKIEDGMVIGEMYRTPDGNVWTNYGGLQQNFGTFGGPNGGVTVAVSTGHGMPNGETYMLTQAVLKPGGGHHQVLAQMPPGLAVQNHHLGNGVVLVKAEDARVDSPGNYDQHTPASSTPTSESNNGVQTNPVIITDLNEQQHIHHQDGLLYHTFQPVVAVQAGPHGQQTWATVAHPIVHAHEVQQENAAPVDVKPVAVKKPRGKKKKAANNNPDQEHVMKIEAGTQPDILAAAAAATGLPQGTIMKPFFPGRRLPSLATIAKEAETGKPKTHFCDQCHRGFSSGYHLTRHQKIHVGEYPAICPECHKTFRDASSLKRHSFVHTRDSPHECAVCCKRFGEIARLQRHMRIHSGEFAHHCEVCSKGFHDTYALSRHQRSHTGDRPYKCHICDKGFVTGSYLKKHLKTHVISFNGADGVVQQNGTGKKVRRKKKRAQVQQQDEQEQHQEVQQQQEELQMQEHDHHQQQQEQQQQQQQQHQQHQNLVHHEFPTQHLSMAMQPMLMSGSASGAPQVVFVAPPGHVLVQQPGGQLHSVPAAMAR